MSDGSVSGELVGPSGEGRWLTLPEAARRLGLSERTVYRRVKRGQLPSRADRRGRITAWVPGDVVEPASDTSPDARSGPSDGSDTLAALLELLRARDATLIELARENERLRHLTTELARMLPPPVSDTSDARPPWWRRWWGWVTEGAGG